MSSIGARRLALLVAANTALAPFAIDAYLPALPRIAEHVGSNVHLAELSLSVFLLGIALGQLIFGPLSDRVGRWPILVGGIGVFVLSSVAITAVQDIHALWALRFVQALGGGACVVNSPAIVRDCFSGREAARVLSTMVMILMLAPLAAPTLGSFLLHLFDWWAIFVFLALYGCLLLLLILRFLPETRRVESKPAGLRQVLRNYRTVLTHREALGYIAAVAFSFAGMFSFITNSPYVYMGYYGVSSTIYPLLFGANIIIMASSNRINIRLLARYSPRQLLRAGLAIQLCAGLTLVAVIAAGLDAIPVVVTLIVLFVGVNGLITPNAVSSMLDHFPGMSATANAVLGSLQFTAGGVAGAVVSGLQIASVWPMVIGMVGASIMANLLVRALAGSSTVAGHRSST
ncbi:DHA1 family bicyclomycin/chloramphenicol resistance-like MFS transporter [Kushneria sinocarnis]|uniref:Bcr/CflA family efflux transporter n=1 Tax=Kushneria sinocarnis TaxID=595502 RepID=A0A420WTH5_9GAMM|nr:Bcr/CflA family multidrug efflux MFS transporter [Kushneria sinocarnis]RKQ96402.1 DHA1 family bicyclomycin/chloramphenicol resistance-like MFS transporter [Kushneria sinocarnis]